MSFSIEVKNVSREYTITRGILKKTTKTVKAVNNISFSVKKGEIFGLLGPNGSGKTTTIKMLSTLLLPNEGEIYVEGLDIYKEAKEIRKVVNVVYGGDRGLYLRLSAEDNLRYFANLYGLPRKKIDNTIAYLLSSMGLSERAKDRVETFSRGMKQRLHIARSLINDPKVLFLDEPTIGLDPKSSRDLRKIIKELSLQGKTILLTSHYLQEIDELCDRIAIINQGNLLTVDTPVNIKSRVQNLELYNTLKLVLRNIDEDEILKVKNYFSDLSIEIYNGDKVSISIVTNDYLSVLAKLKDLLGNPMIEDITITKPSLEDAYLTIIGEAI
ncbi:putative ABC transporter ATP-binding protein YfiL (plasmid) [Geobacillus thermodenitrificans]|uniref:ABC transporter ATP-binding protein n=1 Tax=Geobacillus thermodenitrificans TaxID=33940 RepID=UPI000A290559|nr:ABC transporter ATP-binding protein [Geobacillus thermodenitrificans]ARP44580.1 putative ABC transporter ATP-binding protein YfiL [Geobacillus thermodenitrificans]